MYRKEKESGLKRFKMNIFIGDASDWMVKELIDEKVSILVDRDLLQDIRDHLAYDAWDKANTSSEVLLDKLDSLYPFLNQSK